MECEFPTVNANNEEIKKILESVKTIAVLGLSPDSTKDSYRVAEYLQNDAKFTGYEFELGNSFQLENGTLTATVGLDAVEGKFKNSQMFVPRMMPKRRFINFDYVSGDYSAGISYKEVQPQDNVAEGETGTDGYRMLDLDASKSYELGDGVTFRSSIFIKNLLDETARNHTSFVKNEVPLPGRNVGFKFKITF